MQFPDHEWELDSPERQGVDTAKLNAAVEFLRTRFPTTGGNREVAVIRNGAMIWAGDDIGRVHSIWSVTKSFTSTVLGLLIDDGRCSLDTLACSILPELKTHYPTATLGHFAAMTSGYRSANPSADERLGDSATPFDPAPPKSAPGEMYAYRNDAANEFGNILTHLAGRSMYDVVNERLCTPIGFEDWQWRELATVDGLAVNGGAGRPAIYMSASQLARVGLLFLNRGVWKERRIISDAWIDAATRVQVASTLPYDGGPVDGRGAYGLMWWANGVCAGGGVRIPHAPPRTFWAYGLNNNACFVIPEWNMIVARGATSGGYEDAVYEIWDAFFRLLAEAIDAG